MTQPNFAPAPYATLEIGSHAGFHQYIVDSTGRKIGVAWGPHDQKVWTAALWASAPEMYTALKQCLGVLCESGDLNNYRNLSDGELGRVWIETAKLAASVLNKIDGAE